MPTPTRSRRPTKTTAAKKATAGKPKKAAAKSASAKAAAKSASAKKPAVKKPAVVKAGLRMSENDRCASVARMLQRALRRHPKLKGVRVVAKAARLSFFEVPEESVEAFATILERMWSRIRRYGE
jgi:hypothetical protein